jgi:hypothetical protein
LEALEVCRELTAVHSRHHDVADQKIDRLRQRPKLLQRIDAVAPLEDSIPRARQDSRRQRADTFVVFGDENCVARGRPEYVPIATRSRSLASAGNGQMDGEGGAFAEVARDRNMPAALRDDAIDRCETES